MSERKTFLPPLEQIAKTVAERFGTTVEHMLGLPDPPGPDGEDAIRGADAPARADVGQGNPGIGWVPGIAIDSVPDILPGGLDPAIRSVMEDGPAILSAISSGAMAVISSDPEGFMDRMAMRGIRFDDRSIVTLFESKVPKGTPWISHRCALAIADRNPDGVTRQEAERLAGIRVSMPHRIPITPGTSDLVSERARAYGVALGFAFGEGNEIPLASSTARAYDRILSGERVGDVFVTESEALEALAFDSLDEVMTAIHGDSWVSARDAAGGAS
jgi:hypothetical protein